MAKAKARNKAVHKHDGRGDSFTLLPYVVIDALLVSVSPRAVVALLAIARRFNGFNNGTIALSGRDLAAACGPNNRTNTATINELVKAGFIKKTVFPKGQRRATEYRLTFVSSGRSGELPATNDYLETEKSTMYDPYTRTPSRVYEPYTRGKHRVYEPSTGATETCGSADPSPVYDPYTHILHHPQGLSGPDGNTVPDAPQIPAGVSASSAAMDEIQLRRFVMSFLAKAEPGAQSRLAHAAQIPGGTLSKFLSGRPLPEHHRMPLQLAVGRGGGEATMTDAEAGQLLAGIGYRDDWTDAEVVAAVSSADPELRKWLPLALQIGAPDRLTDKDRKAMEDRDAA